MGKSRKPRTPRAEPRPDTAELVDQLFAVQRALDRLRASLHAKWSNECRSACFDVLEQETRTLRDALDSHTNECGEYERKQVWLKGEGL